MASLTMTHGKNMQPSPAPELRTASEGSLPLMGLPGCNGWTGAPISTVAWAALDGVDSKMTVLKHLESQDQSVGGVHRLVWPIRPAIGVLVACVYNERDFASVASPRDPGKLIRSRVPPSQVCARQFS
jgi:hypothetical protein